MFIFFFAKSSVEFHTLEGARQILSRGFVVCRSQVDERGGGGGGENVMRVREGGGGHIITKQGTTMPHIDIHRS